MAPQIRAYREVEEPYRQVELEGIKYLLVPVLLGKNLLESESFVQDYGLDVSSSRAINELAKRLD